MRRTVVCLAVSVAMLAAAHGLHATTVIQQDTPALVRSSSDIVVGRVAGTRAHWDEAHRHIVTDVTFDVTESLRGEGRQVTLTQLGGEVDGMKLTVAGSPAFKPGEEALLFVWRDPKGRAQVNGLAQGKFEIRRDPATGQRMVGRNLPGLGFSDVRKLAPLGHAEAAPKISLDRMLDEIRRTIADQSGH